MCSGRWCRTTPRSSYRPPTRSPRASTVRSSSTPRLAASASMRLEPAIRATRRVSSERCPRFATTASGASASPRSNPHTLMPATGASTSTACTATARRSVGRTLHARADTVTVRFYDGATLVKTHPPPATHARARRPTGPAHKEPVEKSCTHGGPEIRLLPIATASKGSGQPLPI